VRDEDRGISLRADLKASTAVAKQAGLSWPLPADRRLDQLVEAANESGASTRRNELAAAILFAAPSDGEMLLQLVLRCHSQRGASSAQSCGHLRWHDRTDPRPSPNSNGQCDLQRRARAGPIRLAPLAAGGAIGIDYDSELMTSRDAHSGAVTFRLNFRLIRGRSAMAGTVRPVPSCLVTDAPNRY
jgi:hypothetical protein